MDKAAAAWCGNRGKSQGFWQNVVAFLVWSVYLIDMGIKRYNPQHKELVRLLLGETSLPRDALPYTPEFQRLLKHFREKVGANIHAHDFWLLITTVGKKGGITGKKKAIVPIKVSDSDMREIMAIAPEYIGSRDRLPYTQVFNEMWKRFNRKPGRNLTKHEFWRMVSRVAKRSRKPKPVLEISEMIPLPPGLVRRLETSNPWWQGRSASLPYHFHRWAFRAALDRMRLWQDRAVAIRGPRQVGKTTVQRQIIDDLLVNHAVDPKRILRVEFDQLTEDGIADVIEPILTVIRWYERTVLKGDINAMSGWGTPVYIFFDEFQYVKQWEDQLKFLIDHYRAHVLVTGSSSLRIAEGRESLAGRLSTLDLGPLRLWEVAGLRRLEGVKPFRTGNGLEDWKKPDFWHELVAHGEREREAVDEAFHLYCDWGGFPRCHAEGTTSEIARGILLEDVVARTIGLDLRRGPGGRTRIESLVLEVFRLACRYAGQAPTTSMLARELTKRLPEPISSATVTDYLRFLADAMLVRLVEPLELRLKRQTGPKKLCLCDHALRAALLQETIPLHPQALATEPHLADIAGRLIESVIGYYLASLTGAQLSHFPCTKTEPEVDFILTIGTQRIPIEVKYRKRLPRPSDVTNIRHWTEKEAYNAPFGLLINQDVQASAKLPKNVVQVPAKYLLLLA